jgi:hypothetical protein
MLGSSGQFLAHLRPALGFGFRAQNLPDMVAHIGPFMLGAFAMAFAGILPARTRDARFALIALTTSCAFLVSGLLKLGSSSNYWLEPVFACAAIVAHFGIPERTLRSLAAAGLLVFSVLWSAVATARNARDDLRNWKLDQPALQAIQQFCRKRILLGGKAPAHIDAWIQDAQLENVRCVVEEDRENSQTSMISGMLPPQVEAIYRRRFPKRVRFGAFSVYTAADPAP